MGLIGRVLTRIDDRLTSVLDRHLELAIPTQRSSSPDDDQVLVPLRPQFEVAGYWSHCCCLPGCTDIHRTPCNRDECGQPEGGEAC